MHQWHRLYRGQTEIDWHQKKEMSLPSPLLLMIHTFIGGDGSEISALVESTGKLNKELENARPPVV